MARGGGGIGSHLEVSAQLVDHQGGQRLLLDVLCHDHEGVLPPHAQLQDAHYVTGGGDLFVDQQQSAVLVLCHLQRGCPVGEGKGTLYLLVKRYLLSKLCYPNLAMQVRGKKTESLQKKSKRSPQQLSRFEPRTTLAFCFLYIPKPALECL